ncbi:MAG: extracellular solute-binding protein [Spirochaetales bacterium]|nr:extracellular solute-binding protein [Spirochaetales bacterium]
MKKRIYVFALCLLVFLSFFAAAEGVAEDKLPVRYLIPGGAPKDSQLVVDAINKKLEADGLNIEYQPIFIGWDVWDQKTNLMLTTGEEFEILHIMETRRSTASYKAMGGVLPLDELLDKYGPALKKTIPDWMWDAAKSDGKIYCVPVFNGDASAADGWATVRKDIYDKYFDEWPKTTEEEIKNFAYIWEQEKDGVRPVYDIHSEYKSPHLWRTYDSYPFEVTDKIIFVDKDGNVKSWIETEEFKKDAAYYSKLVKFGIIPVDFLSIPEDMTREWREQGRMLLSDGMHLPWANSPSIRKAASGGFWDVYRFKPDEPTYRMTAYRNSNVISTTSKNPEAGIMFLNWIYSSQENHDLMLNGIKGVHWFEAEGTVPNYEYLTRPEEVRYRFSDWKIGNIHYMRFLTYFGSKGLALRYTPRDDVINHIALGFNFNSESVASEYANCINEYMMHGVPVYFGLTDFDENYAKAVKRIQDAGIDKVIAEYEKQFKAWLASK